MTGNHRALAFSTAAVMVQYDPIVRSSQLMRPRRIGEQRGVVSLATLGVEHGQPCFTAGVEPPGRDAPQLTSRRLFTILTINVKKLRNGRLFQGRSLAQGSVYVPDESPANR